MFARVPQESNVAGQATSAGFWEKKGEQQSTKNASAEKEARKAQSENRSLMFTGVDYQVWVRNLQKKV